MTKRSAVRMSIIGIFIVLLWVHYGLLASQQSQVVASPPVCTMPGNLGYSPGAIVPRDGQTYRCVYVFGQGLNPAGVAWVKMAPLTIRAIQEQKMAPPILTIQEPAGR